MSNILDYYEYAKLATAAYVNLDGKPLDGVTIAGLANEQERLPTKLADQTFRQTSDNPTPWTIPDGGYYGNDTEGFAATLFKRDGESVLAIRGTEPDISLSGDLLKADLGQIGFLGLAVGQAVSMINYILQLQAGTTTQVRQFALNYSLTKPENGPSIELRAKPTDPVKGYLYLTDTASVSGLGLIGAGERIAVTGHSLGGHLAALAARLFPNLISEAYTYNAPGFDPESANIAVDLVAGKLSPVLGAVLKASGDVALQLTDEFTNLVGNYLSTPPAANFNAVTIHTLESEDIDPLPDINIVPSVITGATVYGDETIVTTERNSHMIEPFMDSLALQALLYRMNNQFTTDSIKGLLQAASAHIPVTMENLVESLYKVLKGGTIDLIDVDVRNDDAYGLAGIGTGNIAGRRDFYDKLLTLENIVKGNPSLHIEPLVAQTSDQLIALAKTDIAYRYALQELNPFAITGADYTQYNANGALDLYDPATDTGTLTDNYLTDRAAMLLWKLKLNTEDFVSSNANPYHDAPDQYFEDKTTGEQIVLGNPNMGQLDRRFIIFGSADGETINGGALSDRLYGMSGDDTLNGGGAIDYLEGGAGIDTLNGGEGSDTLYGGTDGDTLNGDGGTDTLVGGSGIDTLDGGADADTLYGDLQDTASTTVAYADELHGGAGNDHLYGGGGDDQLYGDAGINTLNGDAGEDILTGGDQTDTLNGGADNDKLYGQGGIDLLDGGTGDDTLAGNLDTDDLHGGEGADHLWGGAADIDNDTSDTKRDLLYGDAGNDDLHGGGGNDLLDGGEGEDILAGEAGSDTLMGGEGSDTYRYQSDTLVRDIIDDSDGLGFIEYDGKILTGGNSDSGCDNPVWFNEDDGMTYLPDGDPNVGPVNLNIIGHGGSILVRHFINGNLGINLSGNPHSDPACNPQPDSPPAGQPAGLPDPAPPAAPAPGGTSNRRRDPLLIDLTGTGIQTVGLAAGLYFDHNADGLAENTGWAAPGTGLLMLDRNTDGMLTDGSELFGDHTPVGGGLTALNGFAALAQYDRDRDGQITNADPIWNQLKVWRHATDAAGNILPGDPNIAGELISLDDLGIIAIDLNGTPVSAPIHDAQGNTQLSQTTITFADGHTQQIAEYQLARNGADTRQPRIAVAADIAALPDLLGRGNLIDLHQAMQRDGSGQLKALVEGFAGNDEEWRVVA